ncbi:MAG: ABC transporter transmembrane domain-containing protein, partial [Bacteroidia bacterium]
MTKPAEHKGLNTSLIRRILSYTKPYRGYFFSALALTLVLAGLAIVRPLLINKALNDYVTGHKDPQGLNMMCLLILGSLILEACLQFSNIYITSFLGQSIVRDLRNQVYKHIVSLKNSYFDKTPVGMLVTRAISDIESLSDVFAQGFIVISGDIVMLLIFVIVMFVKNWVLTLIVLTTIPLLLVATAMFKNGVKKTFTEVRNAVAALNTFTQEHITGMRIVQLFNREEAELEKFRGINDKHRVANIRSIWYYSIFFPVVEILSAIAIGALIWFTGANSNT